MQMTILGIHTTDWIAIIVVLACLAQLLLDDRYRKMHGMARG